MTDVTNPFDVVNNINKKSGHLNNINNKTPMFIINRCFSNTVDSVHYANEMNMSNNISEQMQYDFYYYGLSKRNRYGKFNKKQKHIDMAFIETIMEVYGYSFKKANEVFDLLLPHKDEIIELNNKGGVIK